MQNPTDSYQSAKTLIWRSTLSTEMLDAPLLRFISRMKFSLSGEDHILTSHRRQRGQRKVSPFKDCLHAVIVVVGSMKIPALAMIGREPFPREEDVHGHILVQIPNLVTEGFQLVKDIVNSKCRQIDEIDVGIPGSVLVLENGYETIHRQAKCLSGAFDR